jgi:hypothetical protein
MSGIIMEQEDLLALKNAELAASREQIDNLVAVVVSKDKRIDELLQQLAAKDDQIGRMTEVLDEVCGIQRRRKEAAIADIARQEEEAGLL